MKQEGKDVKGRNVCLQQEQKFLQAKKKGRQCGPSLPEEQQEQGSKSEDRIEGLGPKEEKKKRREEVEEESNAKTGPRTRESAALFPQQRKLWGLQPS